MANMYDRIEQLCKEKGTNVTALCKASGIGRSTLTELKMGRTKSLSYDATLKIARHFGVSVDYFTDIRSGTDNTKSKSDFEHKLTLLARKGDNISESDKEKLLKIFESTLDTFLESTGDGKKK